MRLKRIAVLLFIPLFSVLTLGGVSSFPTTLEGLTTSLNGVIRGNGSGAPTALALNGANGLAQLDSLGQVTPEVSRLPGAPPLTALPTPVAYYRASDLRNLKDGDPVLSWPDVGGTNPATFAAATALSGFSSVQAPTYAAKAMGGRPAVRFGAPASGNTTGLYASGVTVNTNAFTVLLVLANQNLDNGPPLAWWQYDASTAVGDNNCVTPNRTNWTLASGGSNFTRQQTSSSFGCYQYDFGPTILAISSNGSTVSIRVNGVEADTTTGPGTHTLLGLLLGTSNASKYLIGDVAEVGIYSQALTAAQLNPVEQWLAAHYGSSLYGQPADASDNQVVILSNSIFAGFGVSLAPNTVGRALQRQLGQGWTVTNRSFNGAKSQDGSNTGLGIKNRLTPINAAHTVQVTGTPTGGTLTLSGTYPGTFTTAAIAYNASAATVATAVQAAIQALPYGAGALVTGSGGPLPGSAVTLTYSGTLTGVPMPTLTANVSGLTGGTPACTPASSVVGQFGLLQGLRPTPGYGVSTQNRRYNIAVIYEGVNDSTYADMTALVNAVRSLGFQVIVCSSNDNGIAAESTRATNNASLRVDMNMVKDAGLVDMGAHPLIGPSGTGSNTTYSADGTHLTDAGCQIAADMIAQRVQEIVNPGGTGQYTFSVATVDGASTTPLTFRRFPLAANSAYRLRVWGSARRTDSDVNLEFASYSYERLVVTHSTGAAPTVQTVGTDVKTYFADTGATGALTTADISFSPVTLASYNPLDVVVTGEINKTISWSLRYELTQIR